MFPEIPVSADLRDYIFGEVWSPYQECLHALYCAQECARSEDGPSKQDIDKFLTEAESWNARVSEKSLRLDFDFTKASLTEMKEPTVPTDVELWQILFDRMSNHHETISERRSTSKLDLEQITTDQEYIKRKMDECKTSPA